MPSFVTTNCNKVGGAKFPFEVMDRYREILDGINSSTATQPQSKCKELSFWVQSRVNRLNSMNHGIEIFLCSRRKIINISNKTECDVSEPHRIVK